MAEESEKDKFMKKLAAFHESRGVSMTSSPTIAKHPLDLYLLYTTVKERGGFAEVCRLKMWKEIALACNIMVNPSSAYAIRKQYSKHLLEYECKFDRGGIDPETLLSQNEPKSKKNKAAAAAGGATSPAPGDSDSQSSFTHSGRMDSPFPGNSYPSPAGSNSMMGAGPGPGPGPGPGGNMGNMPPGNMVPYGQTMHPPPPPHMGNEYPGPPGFPPGNSQMNYSGQSNQSLGNNSNNNNKNSMMGQSPGGQSVRQQSPHPNRGKSKRKDVPSPGSADSNSQGSYPQSGTPVQFEGSLSGHRLGPQGGVGVQPMTSSPHPHPHQPYGARPPHPSGMYPENQNYPPIPPSGYPPPQAYPPTIDNKHPIPQQRPQHPHQYMPHHQQHHHSPSLAPYASPVGGYPPGPGGPPHPPTPHHSSHYAYGPGSGNMEGPFHPNQQPFHPSPGHQHPQHPQHPQQYQQQQQQQQQPHQQHQQHHSHSQLQQRQQQSQPSPSSSASSRQRVSAPSPGSADSNSQSSYPQSNTPSQSESNPAFSQPSPSTTPSNVRPYPGPEGSQPGYPGMPDASYGNTSYPNYYSHQQQSQNEMVNRVPSSSSSYVPGGSGSYPPSHYPPPSSPSPARPGRMVSPSSYRRPSYPGPESNSSLTNERNEVASAPDDSHSQQPVNRNYYPESDQKNSSHLPSSQSQSQVHPNIKTSKSSVSDSPSSYSQSSGPSDTSPSYAPNSSAYQNPPPPRPSYPPTSQPLTSVSEMSREGYSTAPSMSNSGYNQQNPPYHYHQQGLPRTQGPPMQGNTGYPATSSHYGPPPQASADPTNTGSSYIRPGSRGGSERNERESGLTESYSSDISVNSNSRDHPQSYRHSAPNIPSHVSQSPSQPVPVPPYNRGKHIPPPQSSSSTGPPTATQSTYSMPNSREQIENNSMFPPSSSHQPPASTSPMRPSYMPSRHESPQSSAYAMPPISSASPTSGYSPQRPASHPNSSYYYNQQSPQHPSQNSMMNRPPRPPPGYVTNNGYPPTGSPYPQGTAPGPTATSIPSGAPVPGVQHQQWTRDGMQYRGYPPPNGPSGTEYPPMYHNSMNRMPGPVRASEMSRMYPPGQMPGVPNMPPKTHSAHLARLLCSSPSLPGSPTPNNHLPPSMTPQITASQHTGTSFGPQPQVVKKEMAFPPGSVEASQPLLIKHKKLSPKDFPQVDPWRLMMSLKSGLLAETTWALDILTVLVSHDNTYLFFGLPHMPGLLDTLLEHYKKCLNEMFEDIVKDSELGVGRSIKNIEQKRKKKWYEVCSYNGDSDSEPEIKRLNGTSEVKKEEGEEEEENDGLMDWDKVSCKMEMFKDIPKNDQYLRMLRSSMNYTLKSRVGKSVKVEETETLFSTDFDKKWDGLHAGFKVEREHWRKGFSESTDHILTHFEPKEKPIKLVKLIKHRRRKASNSASKCDEETTVLPHPSDCKDENLLRSQELAESIKHENSRNFPVNCIHKTNNAANFNKDKGQSKRKVNDTSSQNISDKDHRTATPLAMSEDVILEKALNFSSFSSSSSPSNMSRSLNPSTCSNNNKPETACKSQSGTTTTNNKKERVVTDPANFVELEEEVDSENGSPLHPVYDYCDSLTRRCLCISTLIRNLSFVPMNDVEMSRHAGLLLVLGRLLKVGHTHNLKKRSFEKPEKAMESEELETDSFEKDSEEKKATNTSTMNGSDEIEKSSESSHGLKEEHDDKEIKDIEEDPQECELGKHKSWWSEAIHLIRENTLVTLANISSQLDLEPYPEEVSLTLLDGLFHWATCPSAYAQDHLPSTSIQSLCPRRLALESLMKLSIFDNNVDLLLATPPWERQERLLMILSKMLNRSEDQTLREFALVLLTNFASADTAIARAIAMNGIAIGQLISFIEQSEQAALNVVHTQGLNALKENPELMGTTLDMVRRAAICLLHFARIPENRPLLLAYQQRLLALVFSQILDQGVGAIVADIIYELSLHEDTGIKFPSTEQPIEMIEESNPSVNSELINSSDQTPSTVSAPVSTSLPVSQCDSSLPIDSPYTGPVDQCSSVLVQRINGNGIVEEMERETVPPQSLDVCPSKEDIKSEQFVSHIPSVTGEKCIEKHNCNGEGLMSANEENLIGFSKLESVNMNHISSNQV